ncbi:unnamed protein product [Schistosoma rodhaini]|uniref:1-phosphatidylinositol-3-phosphate 5-kinase n=1 Tax=Schistosoma rodhaini TaxID=6188 RepID=A0AA85FJI2_9TREM|nr:unnamed protein product [Schistosoma rodhaini]
MKSISESGGNSGFLKRFVNKLTSRASLHIEDDKNKFQSTKVTQISADSKNENKLSHNSLSALDENISDGVSSSSSHNQLPGSIRPPERRYWMQDENCKFCFECGTRFTAIRRKHHCRVCGRIFCNQCSNQIVEGTQIGLDGLQRACSYCAETLISTNTNKPEHSLDKNSVRSLNTDNIHGLKKKISLIEKTQRNNTRPKSVPSHVSHLSNLNIRMSTGLLNISNSKALLTSPSYLNRIAVDLVSPNNSTSTSSAYECRDLFPTFFSATFPNGNDASPSLDSIRQTMHTVESSTFGVIRRTPRISQGLVLNESLNIDICSAPFKKISSSHSFECLPSSASQSLFNPSSGQDILYLWSRLWANSPKDLEFSIISISQLTASSNGPLSRVHSHSNENLTQDNNSCKSLQLFRLKNEYEEYYCTYGLVLVHWLVNNVPELERCRMKGRLLCQKFMEFGLLTDLQNPNCKQFHDNFTFYKLKQIDSNSRLYDQTNSRRKTVDFTSFYNNFNVNSTSTIDTTYSSILGIHEPNWLLEINSSENESSRSSTPYLIEGFNDFKSKPPGVRPSFEVGKDVSRMRDCSLESLGSTQKWKYTTQPTLNNHQQPIDFSVQMNTDEYICNMKNIFDKHIYRLVLQDVRDNVLDPSWASILIRLAWNVCQTVHFDLRSTGLRYFQFNRQQKQQSQSNNETVKNNDVQKSVMNSNTVYKQQVYSPMDIRYYVHIKKLLDEDNKNSDLFPGLIFSKRPTHKLMPTVLNNPRILLLDSSISYQRTTSKMTWLESQIMQEEEYITNCVCKILCLHPNIIFVSGTVCYLAQNFIFKSGIILFSNVKQSVLYRIARMTGADILDSIDRLMSNPSRKSDNNTQKSATRLGVCNHFEVRQLHLPDGSTKFLTFMKNNSTETGLVLDSNPIRYITHEATVILRDNDLASLIRAKRCFLFTLRLCYNAQLELAYSNSGHIFQLPHLLLNTDTHSRSRIKSLNKMCLQNDAEYPPFPSPVPRKKALSDLNGSVIFISSTIEKTSISNDEYDKNPCSDLAMYLQGRLLSVSPSVEFRLPYLASIEGQLSYLYPYYTYVIDWPLGRRLNDLMKRKEKILNSELTALKYDMINDKLHNYPSKHISSNESSHPFTKCNLEMFSSPTLYNSKLSRLLPYFLSDNNDNNDSFRKNNFAIDGLIISETLTSSDEALYTDYKARGFMNNNNKQKNIESRRSFPRLWAGMNSILSGHWNSLFNTKHLRSFKSGSTMTSTTTTGFTPTSNVQLISESESVKRLRRSILDPRSYQSLSFLAILFTTKCIMRPEPCVPPLIATVEFYGSNDLPLGLFLEKFCFMQQHCRNPLCNVVMADHIQRFIQTSGSVQLMIRQLIQDPPRSEVLSDIPNQGSNDAKYRRPCRIQMWLFCPICRINSPIKHMSADTWHLSFVKFLDLIINSSDNWAYCGLFNKTSDDAVSEVNTTDASNELSLNSVRHGIENQTMSPILQFQCPHSVYKCLEHCFAFNRKLAIFKYQPVNVYEIVMPPSEIRVFPVKADNLKSESTRMLTTKKLTTEGHMNTTNLEDGYCADSTDHTTASATKSHSQSNNHKWGSKVTNLEKSSHLPSYLYTEASDVLTKYYTINTVIKCHIANQQNEKLSCELSAMLEAYLKVLECDSTRILMDERSEILDFILHPSDSGQKERLSNKQYIEDIPTGISHSLGSLTKPVEDDSEPNTVENEKMSTSDKQTLTTDEKISCTTTIQSRARTHSNSISSVHNGSSETTEQRYDVSQNETKCHNWFKLISSLNNVEQALIVQRLINELKRWMYRFVSDWNFRFNEYELLMKRLEKNIRDKRKKPTLSHISTTVANSSLHPSLNLLSPSVPSQVTFTTSVSPPPPTTTTTPLPVSSIITSSKSANNLLDSTKSSEHNNDMITNLSSSNIPIEVSTSQTIYFNSVDQNMNKFSTVIDLSNNISVNSKTSLNNVLTVSQPELLVQSIKRDREMHNSIENTSSLDSFKSGFNSFHDSINHDSSQHTEDNYVSDLSKNLPILDPLNLKAVYQRRGPEIFNTESSQNQSNKTESSAHPIQNEISIANNSSSSGVRRFIHNFLPSAMDLKVFGEPVPPYEHPQLTICDESCINILKRIETTVNKSNQMKLNSCDYSRLSESICQLLLAHPDVYVNDREFTSIIAFALTTREYERKLVDLHFTFQGSLQHSSDIQLGQPALANFKDNESVVITENMSSAKCIDEKEKRNILDDETSLPNPTDDGSSKKSETSQEESNRISSSSSVSTLRDQKPPTHTHNISASSHTTSLSTPTTDKSNGSRSRHIKIQFSDSSTTFFCCVYYASEFFRLRQLIMPNGDLSFIQSLSRCYQWDARGGKSGSLFMKTRDERFVIKELSSIEMKTFHEISQDYFDYLITAALEQRLCVLSRILGIFHVGFKNSTSGEAHRFDVLVMENLYYGHTQLAYIYDLKGSLRKRLVDESSNNGMNANSTTTNTTIPADLAQTTDETTTNSGVASYHSFTCNQSTTVSDSGLTSETTTVKHNVPVLLDQNLLNASIDNPLYLRVHSKNALSHCLNMDTAFLANLFIMDYSLLVGVDTTTNQLIIGLIDYLRKFTLDKRLEMIIKQTITSAQGPMPTILTPDLYRERFLYQLHSYFPLLPDQWYDSLAEHTENWRVSSVQRKSLSVNKTK